MNSPSIQIAYRCAVCHECVIENVFTMNRRERELGAPVCRECDEQAEAAVIGLMVDSVTRPGPVAEHMFKTTVRYSNNGTEFTPYNRTNQPFKWGPVEWREEYRPPTHRSRNWFGLILGLAAIALAVVAANWVVT